MAQDTTAEVPLTELCAICHVNPIKYTCPRDGIHTCSLPCVKRHKKWAQCSGIRDPAEYRKRSELATPASIDKDFNFITNVERSLSRADDAVVNRGIDLTPARFRPKDTRPKFELEAESRGIKIIKAPKGLSRSKQNRTQWGGQPKCIIWTVEWLCQDGRKIMSVAPEIKSIKELFNAATANSKRHNKKRKRPSNAEGGSLKNIISNAENSRIEQKDGSGQDLQYEQGPEISQAEVDGTAEEKTNSVSLPALQEYFYLHRPNTGSKHKCLIPISSSEPLQDVLSNKTLIEFPTIYVRTESPDQLQSPFITEKEFTQRHGIDIPINISAPLEGIADDEDLEDGELAEADTMPSIDEKKVLEVLAKDLGG